MGSSAEIEVEDASTRHVCFGMQRMQRTELRAPGIQGIRFAQLCGFDQSHKGSPHLLQLCLSAHGSLLQHPFSAGLETVSHSFPSHHAQLFVHVPSSTTITLRFMGVNRRHYWTASLSCTSLVCYMPGRCCAEPPGVRGAPLPQRAERSSLRWKLSALQLRWLQMSHTAPIGGPDSHLCPPVIPTFPVMSESL